MGVVVGVNHSVSTYFRNFLPDIVMLKCLNHSLQLAANKAAEAVPSYVYFLVRLRVSCNWFSLSTKQLLHYEELHKTLYNKVPTRLLQLSSTRWMSRYECIRRIIDQWEPFKFCFTMASSRDKNATLPDS